ncbi:HD-GYP domain-containing protein [Brevibacillus massiliensis]|jgi:HD-GYP domain-containing protein (c-di-GMP phosphodiesterase class II)|uniref:HD-GYP domain-containing protein n=1 Tax=Brevibacillus massiliensis TaxID=1118054 RepID=UPI0002D4AB04|nr:HD-GYP domain-containing protein [Brevibacillus massiliensis]
MPVIAIKNSMGFCLAEDVHTSLGGLLFKKGTVVKERELEILESFKIAKVTVDELAPQKQDADGKEEVESLKPVDQEFIRTYKEAVQSFKKLMLHVMGGQHIPVMEVRKILASLLPIVQDHPNILMWLPQVSNEEEYVCGHSVAVGMLSFMIAKWMKLPEKEWVQISLAGILHDIGKTRIDPKVLWKPTRLTAIEYEEMKKHTIYGYQLTKGVSGLSEGVALAALQHHEREDGSGYPLGLVGNKLHIYSKIVAVAEVYHGMCSDHLHKKAVSPYQAVEQLLKDSYGKLDPAVVHTFVNGLTQFSVGTTVELTDGSIGKIIFADRNDPTRPLVELNGRVINLAEARQLFIKRIV